MSIVDGTAELPEAIAPSEPGARRPTAQWVAHHNAIFDLAWFQVRQWVDEITAAQHIGSSLYPSRAAMHAV